MTLHVMDIIGAIGGVLILFAFYRTSIGKWTGKSLLYELDNLVGALCLSVYSFSKGAQINMPLNGVWVIVAIVGVTSIYDRRHSNKKPARRR